VIDPANPASLSDVSTNPRSRRNANCALISAPDTDGHVNLLTERLSGVDRQRAI
jgi:hypothetical protein